MMGGRGMAETIIHRKSLLLRGEIIVSLFSVAQLRGNIDRALAPLMDSLERGGVGLAERVNLEHKSFEIILKSMFTFFVIALAPLPVPS